MGFKYSSDTELSLKEDEKNIFKLRDICIGKKEIWIANQIEIKTDKRSWDERDWKDGICTIF